MNSNGLCVCPCCGNIVLREDDDALQVDNDEEAIDCTCLSCMLTLSVILGKGKRSLIGNLRQVTSLPDCDPSSARLYSRDEPEILLGISKPSNTIRDLDVSKLRLGMVVEVSYNGYGWCKAVIANIRTRKKPYTYDIEYDDGEYEQRVIRKRIRIIGDRFVTTSRQISADCSFETAIIASSSRNDTVEETLQVARQLVARTNFICEVVNDLYKAQCLIDTMNDAYAIPVVELSSDEDESAIELSSDEDTVGTAACPILVM